MNAFESSCLFFALLIIIIFRGHQPCSVAALLLSLSSSLFDKKKERPEPEVTALTDYFNRNSIIVFWFDLSGFIFAHELLSTVSINGKSTNRIGTSFDFNQTDGNQT
jgi:hypothetical protein